MPFFRYKGKKIFYQIKEAHNQNALIFIHGSGCNLNSWKNQFNLELDYKIIAFDLPSHDNSDGFSRLSLDLYVDVLKTLIDSLGIEKVILCGHSLGGAIAQTFYFKHPSKIKALILCGSGGRLRVSPVILDSLKNNYEEYLDIHILRGFYKKTPKKLIEIYKKETSTIGSKVTYQDFKICDQFDILDKIHTISIPCLIICGDSDYLTPAKYSQYFHDKIENSKLVIIEKAGHMVMIEKPEQVNQAIEIFINNELN